MQGLMGVARRDIERVRQEEVVWLRRVLMQRAWSVVLAFVAPTLTASAVLPAPSSTGPPGASSSDAAAPKLILPDDPLFRFSPVL